MYFSHGDAGDVRRHRVHQQRRWIGSEPARHVQPDPAHRHPPLGHGPTGDHLGRHIGPALVGVYKADPLDRDIQGRAHERVERGHASATRLGCSLSGFAKSALTVNPPPLASAKKASAMKAAAKKAPRKKATAKASATPDAGTGAGEGPDGNRAAESSGRDATAPAAAPAGGADG